MRAARTLNSVYRLDESVKLATEARDGLATTVGEGDERTIRARDTLAAAFSRAGRKAESDKLLRHNLDIAQHWLGPEHRLTLSLQRAWGFRLHQLDRWSEAEPLLRSSLETQRRLFGEDDYRTLYFMWTLGYALAARDAVEEGRRLIDEGIDGLHRVFGERHTYTAYATAHRAEVEQDNGELAAAENSRRLALGILRDWLGDDHPHVLDAQTHLAVVLCHRDKCDDGEALLAETVQRFREIEAAAPMIRARTLRALATMLARRDRITEAVTFTRERLTVLRDSLGDVHRATILAARDLARLLRRLDQRGEAEQYFALVIEGRTHLLGESARKPLFTRNELATMLKAQPDRLADAEAMARETYDLARTALGENDQLTINAGETLADVLLKQGKPEEAAKYRALLRGPERDEASE